MLPAYLDLWAQTSPAPIQFPDVSLWLHGPISGPPDVQVVWRADLSEDLFKRGDLETAVAVVTAVRPSSLEALSLPFVTARAWLANKPTLDFGDTEGSPSEEGEELKTEGRLALRWRGDESEIICAQSGSKPSLKPGDTIIVPASYGGIQSGCFDATSADPVQDRAEQAELFTRARPVLRLHPVVVGELGISLPLDEPEEVRAVLHSQSSNSHWPEWKCLWAEKLAEGRGSLVVPGEHSWTVIEARRVPSSALRAVLQSEETLEDGVELTTDADDSFYAGKTVSLAEHSGDVERFAREYAVRCGIDPWLVEHIAIAAWLHDIGKADRRFQIMLRGGSEIVYFNDETLLAKSALPPGARTAHRLAQQRSGYPRGARHELQSLAMLQGHLESVREKLERLDTSKKPDLDLVLHLVASHHGYCRPFAPVIIEETPIDVMLQGHMSATFGAIDFPATTSKHELHRLDSPLADRFWTLIAKYGWLELCWFEAILRLADHRASEEEQNGSIDA